jgi:bifunctional non-homologous end joining protein LigD
VKYEPQLATLVKVPPSGDQWLHEIKFDGYRIGCYRKGSRVSLTSRNGKDWTAAFPDVVEAVKAMDVDEVMLDGEVAAVLPDGRTSFQAMQRRAGSGATGAKGTIVYFVFDLLRLDEETLTRRPLDERKARLKALLGRSQRGRLRYSEHVDGSGTKILEHACGLGLEGIISKRRDLPYMSGRSDAWRKIKCTRRQELVIGGFTDPQGARAGIGALLLGTYGPGGQLTFAGRVGTGFSHQTALDLREKLERIEQAAPPFSPPPTGPLARTAHWVMPQLVCEVAFTEWTDQGQLRHPSFQGLRLDKRAVEVVREEPVGTPHAPSGVDGTHGPTRRPRVRGNR